MVQRSDFFMVSSGALAARCEDGSIRQLSNCETLSILQNENATLPVVSSPRRNAQKATTYVVKITAIHRRTVSTHPQALVA